MKAKNVSKNVGKEVVIKVPLDKVTNYSGCGLSSNEILKLGITPLTIGSGHTHTDGDVQLLNGHNEQVYVHRKFIKLASEVVEAQSKYTLEVNICQCHSETCNCDDYLIVDNATNTVIGGYSTEQQASEVLAILDRNTSK